MRTYLTLIVMLLTSIYMLDNIPMFSAHRLPLSEPTPVEQFMSRIAQFESGNNHKIVNQYGMMGKYQFSPTTVRGLGFKVSRSQFLENPHLQDSVMYAYMKYNHRDLEPYIERYEGKTVKGVKMTRATILAGAHFAGSGGMKAFFHSSNPNGTVDGNGMTLRRYMSNFSQVHLPSL